MIKHAGVLTADPRGLGVVNGELWFVQVGHSQPGLAAAGELGWGNTGNSSQVYYTLTALSLRERRAN